MFWLPHEKRVDRNDNLPSLQVQEPQFKLHISYFYKNAKKANPKNEICLYDI